MSQESCIYFGPPGTGKTTTLTRLIRQYAEAEGDDTVLATSFTRAAARELAGRDLPLPEHMVGTLHSLCYHALDAPPIAESLVETGAWNSTYPHYALEPQDRTGETSGTHAPDERERTDEESSGASLLHQYNLFRAACPAPETPLPPLLQHFAQRWEAWKQSLGARDFTDLLQEALAVLPLAPGNPRTIVVDEAQDFTPLQWRVLTRWGRAAQRLLVGGDDDQALYTWAGADPSFLLAVPDDSKRVLPLSYRLPRAVYRYACTYLEAMHTRQPKTWQPRAAPGRVHFVSDFLHAAQEATHATLDTPSQTCAVLAPCSYMLAPLLVWLKSEGIPFANPWRLRRGDWNPLRPPARGISSVARLLDFLRPSSRLWTWQELASWLPLLRTKGVLRPEASTHLALYGDETRPCTLDDLDTLCYPEAVPPMLAGNLSWLGEHLRADRARVLAYPLRVYRRYGAPGLQQPPRILVGTMHSVKGGEADTVVMTTALSKAFAQARAMGGDAADSVERMLYVGSTRARETLLVADRWS